MSNWTDEKKQQVIDMYVEQNPTPETSVEIVKKISEDMDGESVNGIRAILIKAGVYKTKGSSTATTGKGTSDKKEGSGTKRVSKESQIAALKEAIEAKGAEVDEDILSKLTGKAATYFTEVLTK